jgi:hypothetical protein
MMHTPETLAYPGKVNLPVLDSINWYAL